MSYRNPKQYIDTQSGKYYVDMINKISAEGRANVQAIRKSNAERVRKNEATLSGIEKESLKLRTDFTKAAVSNGGLDLYKGFEPYIDEYSQIAQRLAFGKSENPTLDKKRQAQILALPQMANEGISMLLDAAEQTREAASIKGMGGLDLKASDEDNLRAALTWLDNVKGSRNYTVVEEGGTLVPAFEINGKQYSTNSIKKHIEEEYGIVFGTKIPDETSNFQEAAKLSMITDPDNVENKILDPKYLSEKVKQSKPDKNGVVTLYKEINKDALAASPVGVDLKADAGALLKMPGVEAISFWNNILDPEGDFPWDYKEILTKEQEAQFVDQYVEYGLSNYIQQQHKVGERKIEKPKELTATEKKESEKLKVTTEQLDGIKNFPMEINVEEVTVIGDKGISDKFELINKLAQNMVKDIPGKSLKLKQIEGGDVEFLLGNVSMGTASIEDLTSEEVKKFVYKMYGGSPKEIGGLSGEVLPKVQKPFQEFARK